MEIVNKFYTIEGITIVGIGLGFWDRIPVLVEAQWAQIKIRATSSEKNAFSFYPEIDFSFVLNFENS